ncbi:signal peptide peptidase SppA [bacterium AH-315-J21]|nr:signal peptide peptidase SppA [bacterium AH-315-J21]
MANKKDVIIGLVIGGVFLVGLGMMAVLFFAFSSDGEDYVTKGSGQIAVVELFGGIYDPAPTVKQIEKWSKRDNIKAIVIHINSPGGGVAASQEIYEALNRARNEYGKVVVAAMSSVAASGGYYVACGADWIVSNPGTLTGSIGVILQYPTFGELMKKVGVELETIKSGELKDVGNYSRRMTDAEEQMLRSVIMDSYEQFVEVVARGRGMETEAVKPLADGRIYTGLQAYNLGLVDTLGTFHDALNIAADLVGLEANPETVREVKRKPGFFELMGETVTSVKTAFSAESVGPQLLYLYH